MAGHYLPEDRGGGGAVSTMFVRTVVWGGPPISLHCATIAWELPLELCFDDI